MPITVQDFPKLTTELQSIFNETAKRSVADNVGFTLFDVFDTDRLNYKHLILHGLRGIKKVTGGEDLPKINAQEGDYVFWTQAQYGGVVSITEEMRLFDLYQQIYTIVQSVTDSAFAMIDQSFADTLLKGWSASYTDVYGDTVLSSAPDGQVLFYGTHTSPGSSVTFSNVISDGTNTNPPLSYEAIKYMRAQGAVHRDPANLIRPINYNLLIVPPALETLANRIINSQYLPGSANNDINPVFGKMKVVVWPRLQLASDGTDTSAYWFMADEAGIKETVEAPFAKRPTLAAPHEQYLSVNWDYRLNYFMAIGVGYPAYIAGSKGDKS